MAKPKAQIAREHLERAQAQILVGDIAAATEWLFASLEAAIDAISEREGIAIDKQHWKRAQAAESLHVQGVLEYDYSELHAILNAARKAVIYEGEEPDLAGTTIDDAAADVESLVMIVEET
jgi:hypothetical protein